MGAEKSTPELVKEFKEARSEKMNQHYYDPFEKGYKKSSTTDMLMIL